MTELQDHRVIKNADTIGHRGQRRDLGEAGEKLPIGGLGWGEERILFFSPSTRRTSNSSRRKQQVGGGSEMRNTSCHPGLLPHTEGEAQ